MNAPVESKICLAGVATELLETDNQQLECNARKLKTFALDELKAISISGTLEGAPKIQGVMELIANGFSGDTQEIEGINSIIRLVGNRCPRIRLSQLSARIVLKKSIGVDSLKNRKRWSSVKKLAAPLFDDIIASNNRYMDVLGNLERWETPQPIDMGDLSEALSNTDQHLEIPMLADLQSASNRWGALQGLRCKKLMEQCLAGTPQNVCSSALLLALVFVGPDGVVDSTSFITCASHHSIVYLLGEESTMKLAILNLLFGALQRKGGRIGRVRA